MFESIELRQAKNGFVVIVHTEEETNEYVMMNSRQVIKFIKEQMNLQEAN